MKKITVKKKTAALGLLAWMNPGVTNLNGRAVVIISKEGWDQLVEILSK